MKSHELYNDGTLKTQNGSYYYGLIGGANDIYFADLDPETGKTVMPLAKAIRSFEGFNVQPVFSPDGQQLAFMISDDSEWSLQIAPSSGGDMHEKSRLRKDETVGGWGLTWTPDGRHLLFLGPKDEATKLCELWRIPVEGGEPQKLGLMVKSHPSLPLSFHPDGHRIAFTGPGPRPGREVWVMENFLPESTASG